MSGVGGQGMGASVLRREDRRFLLGKGRYTDDIVLPGQTWGVFVRSPYAHAAIRSIDASQALASPGVLAVLTGEDVAADGLGGVPCGWQITSKDGSVMVEPPHPALALGKVRHAGDPVVVGHRRDQGAGQGRRPARGGGLRPAARRGAPQDRRGRRRRPGVGRGSRQRLLRLAHRGCRGHGRRICRCGTCGVDRPGQQPHRPQRHRAARGQWRLRLGRRQIHALHHVAEPAPDAAAPGRLHPQGAGAQAAGGGAGRGRRLRIEDLSLRRGAAGALGVQAGRAAREMDLFAQRGVSFGRPWPGPRVPRRAGPGRRRQVPGPAGAHARQPGRVPLDFRAGRADLSPRHAPFRAVRAPRHLRRGEGGCSPTPCPWTPSAAPAGPRPPICWSAWWTRRRASWESIAWRSGART